MSSLASVFNKASTRGHHSKSITQKNNQSCVFYGIRAVAAGYSRCPFPWNLLVPHTDSEAFPSQIGYIFHPECSEYVVWFFFFFFFHVGHPWRTSKQRYPEGILIKCLNHFSWLLLVHSSFTLTHSRCPSSSSQNWVKPPKTPFWALVSAIFFLTFQS